MQVKERRKKKRECNALLHSKKKRMKKGQSPIGSICIYYSMFRNIFIRINKQIHSLFTTKYVLNSYHHRYAI